MNKKLLAILLGTCMVTAAFTGCGQEKTEESVNTSTEQKESSVAEESSATTEESKVEEEVKDYSDVTFRIAWWGGDARAESTSTILDEFAKQFPGLNIEIDYAASADYFTKINTQAAAGDLPDVIQLKYEVIPQYASAGQLIEISSYVGDGIVDLSDVDVNLLAGCKYEGGLYGIPTGMNMACMYYNKTILDELGLSLSTTPTVSEYTEVAKTIYEKTGAKTGPYDQYMVYRSCGGDEFVLEGDGLGFDLEAYTKYLSDYNEGLIAGYYVRDNDVLLETDMARFEARQIWSLGGSSWSNSFMKYEDGTTDDLGLCAPPVADDATVNAVYAKPNTIWSITKDCEHPEIAAAFLDFFTNNQFVYDTCGTDRGLPASAAMREYMKAKATEAEIEVYEYIEYMESNGLLSEINANVPTCATEVRDEYYGAKAEIVYGDYPMEDIPALAEKTMNAMLAVIEENK